MKIQLPPDPDDGPTMAEVHRLRGLIAALRKTVPMLGFIDARLREDEDAAHEAAQAIGNGEWGPADRQVRSVTLTVVADTAAPRHISRHDPARVLREITAKRELIETAAYRLAAAEDLERQGVAATGELRAPAEHLLSTLAAVYSDHPDYREEWRP